MPPPPILRIGALHGARQDVATFESTCRTLLRKLRQHWLSLHGPEAEVELHLLPAPYAHPERGGMWFATHLCLSQIGSNFVDDADVGDTMDIVQAWVRARDITMLVGFSQGGNVVATYLRLRNADRHIDRAIIVSGYDYPRYVHDFPIEVERLVIVYSDQDDVVSGHYTSDLVHTVSDTTHVCLVSHDHGHRMSIPASGITQIVALVMASSPPSAPRSPVRVHV